MGFTVFTVGSLMAISGLLLAALGLVGRVEGWWIIALIACGQALAVGGASFLGEDRVERLASAGKPRPTAARQRVGSALLVAHLLLYLWVWSIGVLSYAGATDADPLPSVFGIPFGRQGPVIIWGVVVAELSFLAAVYVLGPQWRQRFTQLFRYQPQPVSVDTEMPRAPPTFRYRLGLGVFIVGNVLATAGLVLPALGFAKGPMVGVIAVMLGAGEVISLSSVFLLGKEGFKELKAKLFGALKRVPTGKSISHRRHRTGCALLALHVALQFAALVFPIASHYGVVADGTFPEVLGLNRDEQLRWFVGLLAAAEIVFFAGVYTLGADWWGRFRALFEKGSDPFSRGLTLPDAS
jgi:hypothetical protein